MRTHENSLVHFLAKNLDALVIDEIPPLKVADEKTILRCNKEVDDAKIFDLVRKYFDDKPGGCYIEDFKAEMGIAQIWNDKGFFALVVVVNGTRDHIPRDITILTSLDRLFKVSQSKP
jgi:hypothetical protein